MALSTHSLFYYGLAIPTENRFIDFDEGGSPLVAELSVKGYTLEELATEIQTKMNEAGGLDYTVTVDRATRILTIAASGAFTLLAASGTNVGFGAWGVIGFPATDVTGTSASGSEALGSSFAPQFTLQDYLPPENNRRLLSAVTSKSASGKNVTVQAFGEERFVEFSMKYITDRPQPEDFRIKNNPNAVEEANAFLAFITSKDKFQFMPDINTPETFYNVIVESIGNEREGIGYRLREIYDQGLPGYFESGILVLKVIEE